MVSRFSLVVCALGIAGAVTPKVEHVVVMMLENRAFDHMLGWMKRGGPQGDTRVDGLTGNECVPKNLSDPSAGTVCVNDQAKDHCPYDPNHSFAATTERIFACRWNKTANTPCTDMKMDTGDNSMNGFVDSARHEGRDGENEMSMWPSEKVPIITTLAKEYALFDRFFASHPGSTYPNRQFVLSCTAHGMTDTGNKVPAGGFPQKTVLRSFEEAGMSWRLHYEDSLAWAIFMKDVQRSSARPNIRKMAEFYTDARAGTLANFTFLEPRINPNPNASGDPTYGLANHQHPTASVQEGERWMKDVYEAVRNGPKWNNTLLLITYDEHGGFFDHVPPPQAGVPSPDNICTKEGFNYNRLGVRIPTIAVSPLIAKGTLVHQPPASQKPAATSQYELSSVPATLRKLFPSLGGPLNVRDSWAATFEHVLSLSEPRTDCPAKLPVVPPPPSGELSRQLKRPIDEHAEGLMQTLCQIVDRTGTETAKGCSPEEREQIQTYEDFAPWVVQHWQAWVNSEQELTVSGFP